ncbi:hypothetical protein JYU34_021285 [Plutella xylostella]|uniref:Uncharacterized protein n=1 Tax=Plutella xylostella TaxID=51655 RepID=A0ABQ7PTF4_PLUXY|nr:hypothetical protein JYU34_021285 [Plutella xylostella]
MHYIVVVQLDFLVSSSPTSWKIKGLHPEELTRLKDRLTKLKVMFSTTDDFFEIDMAGVDVLNMLADENYRIIGQSMVIEKSTVGGGIVQVEKTSWTLEKQ